MISQLFCVITEISIITRRTIYYYYYFEIKPVLTKRKILNITIIGIKNNNDVDSFITRKILVICNLNIPIIIFDFYKSTTKKWKLIIFQHQTAKALPDTDLYKYLKHYALQNIFQKLS